MLEEKEKDNQETGVAELVEVLKEILDQHTGLSKIVSQSIICTFIEQMTTGKTAMVINEQFGGINAVVHYGLHN